MVRHLFTDESLEPQKRIKRISSSVVPLKNKEHNSWKTWTTPYTYTFIYHLHEVSQSTHTVRLHVCRLNSCDVLKIVSPKVDTVHLEVVFSAGETFRHSSRWLLQSQLTAGFQPYIQYICTVTETSTVEGINISWNILLLQRYQWLYITCIFAHSPFLLSACISFRFQTDAVITIMVLRSIVSLSWPDNYTHCSHG